MPRDLRGWRLQQSMAIWKELTKKGRKGRRIRVLEHHERRGAFDSWTSGGHQESDVGVGRLQRLSATAEVWDLVE